MKRIVIFLLLICILLTINGCWDRRYLKDHALILAIGYDLNEDETISKTVSFPLENPGNKPQSDGEQVGLNETITVKGNTIGEADIELDRHLSQKFDRSKTRVLLLGKELAENGIFSILDAMYRDPRGPLGASVVIVEEKAEEGLNVHNKQSFLPSEYYFNLLKTAEESGIIVRENIQTICPKILSGTKDIILPFIKIEEGKNKINLDGLALFSGDQMKKVITDDHSIMLLILAERVSKKIRFNLQVTEDEEEFEKNFVTFAIRKEEQKLDVSVHNDKISANVHIDLRVEIEEYPKNKLYEADSIPILEKQIKKKLTSIAEETIDIIQEANNDALGFGEKVKAFHYQTWEQIDWRKVYPEIPIEVTINVEVSQHGIIS